VIAYPVLWLEFSRAGASGFCMPHDPQLTARATPPRESTIRVLDSFVKAICGRMPTTPRSDSCFGEVRMRHGPVAQDYQ
jgi:hypothetical protein